MMILRNAAPSPFGRKVRIAADILGQGNDITIENTDTNDPADAVRRQNPIGKIPVLILEDGTTLFDSRVILEYLDHRSGGDRIIPREADARFSALRLQALCDGIMDASILRIYETRFRPAERREPKWLEHQTGKVTRALATLEGEPPTIDATPNVGQIALACALGYLDLRFEGWRPGHPRLVAWLDAFAAHVPSFAQTKFTA